MSSLLLVWDGAKILADAAVSGGEGYLATALGPLGTRRVVRTEDGGLPDFGGLSDAGGPRDADGA